MKIKVCGMKLNVDEVAALTPDYLGFIFYEMSPRNFTGEISGESTSIKKVGVFVNEKISVILNKIEQYELHAVQLHGSESEVFCKELKILKPEIELWKAFSIAEGFEFKLLEIYNSIDKILLDTKGLKPGGNGVKFNWKLLENHKINKPFILSGGIGLGDKKEIQRLKSIQPNLQIIDINSQFEIKEGLKNVEMVKEFIHQIKEIS